MTLCVPAARAAVAQVAVRALPLPASATAAQPAIDVAPSLKLTVPVGAEPVTVAVNVTLAPTVDGVSDVATIVDVATAPVTTCDNALLIDETLPASPPYCAVMLWVPAARADVLHVAVRVLPLPASATALQPESDVAPSLKLMVPVGATPVTDAVNVTTAPETDGVPELASAVEDVAFTTCDSAALVDARLPALPE